MLETESVPKQPSPPKPFKRIGAAITGTIAVIVIVLIIMFIASQPDTSSNSASVSDKAATEEQYHPSDEVIYPYDISKNPYKLKGHSGILDTVHVFVGEVGHQFPMVFPGGGLKFERMLDEHTATYEVLTAQREGLVPDGEIAVILPDSNPPEPLRPWRVYVEGPMDAVNGMGASMQITTIRFEGYFIPPPKPAETTTTPDATRSASAPDTQSQQPVAASQEGPSPDSVPSTTTGESTPIANTPSNVPPIGITPSSTQDPTESKRLNTEGLHMLSGANPNFASARNDFERAFQLDSTNVEALNNLGYVYGRLGDYHTAESTLLKVIAMSPTRKAAQGNLGAIQAELGKTQEAANHFCQYIRLFDSLEHGKSTLTRANKDSDQNVQAAISMALANCN